MLLIRIITILIAGVSISKSYIDYRHKREPAVMFIFWCVVWSIASLIIVYPPLIDKVLAYTKDKSITVGSLTGLGFLFILFIVYRIYVKVSRVEYNQTKLIREVGLHKLFTRRKKK